MSKRAKLIFMFSVIIVGSLVVISLLFSPTPLNPNFPTPTPTPDSSFDQIKKGELLQFLPIQTEEFDIEYLSAPDMILVTLKKAPEEQSRKAAEQWFKEKKVSDFAKYNIQFVISLELKEKPLFN